MRLTETLNGRKAQAYRAVSAGFDDAWARNRVKTSVLYPVSVVLNLIMNFESREGDASEHYNVDGEE